MAVGNKDRVGFVKQDTAKKVIDSGMYGSMNDYTLLCPNGETKRKSNSYLGLFFNCNLAATKRSQAADDTLTFSWFQLKSLKIGA